MNAVRLRILVLACLAWLVSVVAAWAIDLQTQAPRQATFLDDPVVLAIRDRGGFGQRRVQCIVTDPKNGQAIAYTMLSNDYLRQLWFPADFSGFFHHIPGRYVVRWDVDGVIARDQFELVAPPPGAIETKRSRH